MSRVIRVATLVALFAALGANASIGRLHHRGARADPPPPSPPATTHEPAKNFGSYIVTCSLTDVTFYNFATQNCEGNYTFFSSPLNQCAGETIPILNRNMSWNAVCNIMVDEPYMEYHNFIDSQCATIPFLSRKYNLGGCYPCPNAECKDAEVAPEPVWGVLYQQDAPWLENQWHVEPGVVFVTSMNAGTIYKGTYNASSDCVTMKTCNVSVETWITGYKAVTGISYDVKSRKVFALAVEDADVETNVLIAFSVDMPNNHSTVVRFGPELNLYGNLSLNGLARHDGVASVFYATNLGNFTPMAGSVLAVDAASGKVVTIMSNLTAADGAFVWAGLLYVSEVFSATVHVFDIRDPLRPMHVRAYVAPGMTSLDDFFVTGFEREAFIIGADWEAGRVVSWHANGTDNASTVHAAGLWHPTSVRPELDKDGMWRSDYVTVTQGGMYPAVSRGANSGAVFRLRIRDMPRPIVSAGSLAIVNYTDATCSSVQATAVSFQLEQCLHLPGTGTSEKLSCSLLGGVRKVFQTPDCKGESKDELFDVFKCNAAANGQSSTLNFCASL